MIDAFDEVLAQYERPELSESEEKEIRDQAYEHLQAYLVGDGDIRHLHEYNELMDKIE